MSKMKMWENNILASRCIKFDYLEDSDAELISDLAFICPEKPHDAILGAGEH